MKTGKNYLHLLLVDDDTRIRTLLQKYLISQGYLVSSVSNAFEAEKILNDINFDLIILDLMMPGKNGIIFTQELRASKNLVPIIMLTAMGEFEDRIAGLENGADDYLVKPFEPKELLLRISKILKRNRESISDTYHFMDFTYNFKSFSLTKKNKYIFLTQSEHLLINILIKNANMILSREILASELSINERSVDVQIIRLRNKIEQNPSQPQILQTMRGQGYILRV